jgi:CBS domain-containing protein
MSTELVTVTPEDTLRSAIELLSARRIGGAVVVAGRRAVGVVSATDILEFEASTPPVPAERADQMEWGEPGAPAEWQEAESPAAYYTDVWADAGADVLERFRESGGPEWDLLAEHTVGEAMTAALHTIPGDADVASAADAMIRAGIHRLLVTENDRVAGILTTTDIVRAVARRRLRP